MSRSDADAVVPDQPRRSDDPIQRLTRWQDAGGHWQVVGGAGGGVTIALKSCDGGEEMARFSSTDPDLLAFVGDRQSSDE